MMQKNYLKFLESVSKKFAKRKDIADVILYGSVVKGRQLPRDIDLLIVFNNKPLMERTEVGQVFKELLSQKFDNLDIKTINLEEFFKGDFLARSSVIIEGYSLLKKKILAEMMGFQGKAIFTYALKNLNHNNKTKFTYALIGRREKGILEKLGAEHLGRGVVAVPISNSLIFEEFLGKWNVDYKKKSVLVSLI